MKKTKHEHGHWTATSVAMWFNTSGHEPEPSMRLWRTDGWRSRRTNAIKFACATGGCRAYRFGYFRTDGSFIRFGPIRHLPKGKATR